MSSRSSQSSLRRAGCAGFVLVLGAASGAQDLGHKAPPQSRPIGIRGATLHTVANGTLPGGALVFDGGVIRAVFPAGARPTGPADTHWIDVDESVHVYPGFVAFQSAMGLAEIGSVDMTLDLDEAGGFSPEVCAGVAVNPDSWAIPVTRANGVLTCGVLPTGGRVPGRASVVRMDGWTWKDMALVLDAGLVLTWPSMGPFEDDEDGKAAQEESERALGELDRFFDAALAYGAARAADPALRTDLRLEALLPAATGESRVFIGATRQREIEAAVHWARERALDFAIVGAHQALECQDLLVRHDVPVVLVSAHRLPRRRDVPWAEPYELPGRLQAAGVRFALAMPAGADSNAELRNLPYEAAACIPHGLDEEAALRSITLSAAELLGVGAELGSLEAGKRATLFLADGDVFELTTNVVRAFVDGREIDLATKQTALAEKYRAKYRELGLLVK